MSTVNTLVPKNLVDNVGLMEAYRMDAHGDKILFHQWNN